MDPPILGLRTGEALLIRLAPRPVAVEVADVLLPLERRVSLRQVVDEVVHELPDGIAVWQIELGQKRGAVPHVLVELVRERALIRRRRPDRRPQSSHGDRSRCPAKTLHSLPLATAVSNRGGSAALAHGGASGWGGAAAEMRSWPDGGGPAARRAWEHQRGPTRASR